MKTCSKCSIAKPLVEFPVRTDRTGGYKSWCRQCMRDSAKEWRKSNPEIARRATKRWRLSNPATVTEIQRRRIYKRRGLTLESAMAMLAAQDFKCANPGCGIPLTWGRTGNSAALDHCHASNQARAFLCQGCNVALGRLGDNCQRIRGLAIYLEGHRAEILRIKTA
jgi:hypothetical protein